MIDEDFNFPVEGTLKSYTIWFLQMRLRIAE
jgi:hypothetical protein